MKHYALILVAVLSMQFAFSLEKLPEKYLIAFGNPENPIKITEYFSFHCPHCLALFRSDFKKIQTNYIESGDIYWTFHPIPNDLVTVQGMICLERLNNEQKKLFLEAILEETKLNDPEITAALMKRAMELFEKPIPLLLDDEFLQNSDVFMDAFNFLKQKDLIQAIPVVEINSQLFPTEIPDFEFIQKVVQQRSKGLYEKI